MSISKQELPELRRYLNRQFADDSTLRNLAEAYCTNPLVLYTGAGVSRGGKVRVKGEECEVGLPTWLPLLKEVVREAGKDKAVVRSTDPWQAAQEAVDACGGKESFDAHLRRRIERPCNYEQHNGQLTGSFVRCATTLASVAAFCGRLTGQIAAESNKESPRTYFTTDRNPRVAAVLTANYDCFLESASSNLFRTAVLKPVTAKGSLAASMTRTPVFHVHGYVPHPVWQGKSEREPTVPGLVITREDYDRAWDKKNVFGTTMAPQIHYLRHYTVLFVGFSFQDEYVGKLLRQLKDEFKQNPFRSHYAFLPQDGIGDAELGPLGVLAIRWQEPEELRNKLKRVYQAGLWAGGGETLQLPEVAPRVHTPTARTVSYPIEGVWDILSACRNEGVPASLAGG